MIMAKYVYLVEQNNYFKENGCDYRAGAFIGDVRAFSNKASALAYIADCISFRVSKGECEFERFDYKPIEVICDTIKEHIIFSQESYNDMGWRFAYSYKKMLIETEFVK